MAGPWLHSAGKFDELVATITNGVPRTALKDQTRRFPMNPRGGPMNLNDDQVQAVAAYVDHTQPTRQTAGRSHAEARFERATEPQPLKDRALAVLTEGGEAR